jgi:Zn-dependent protease with chaperone function
MPCSRTLAFAERAMSSYPASEMATIARVSRGRLGRGADPVRRWALALYAIVIVLGAGGLLAATFSLATGIGRLGIDGRTPHRLAILGLHVSYPYANPPAMVLVTLAAIGAVVLVTGVRALARHLAAHRSFMRGLAALDPRPRGDVLVFCEERPQAFCAGLARPRVYVSSGALLALGADELGAVLAHERHHRERRDPLRATLATVLAEALFFLPVMARLRDRFLALLELGADDAAVAAYRGDAAPLAAAMLVFDEAASPAGAVGIAPERVEHLLGTPLAWRLPRAPLAAGAVSVAAMLVGAWAAGQHAVVRTTLAVPGLSHQPCVLVLAAIPGVLAAAGAAWLRR